MKSNYAEKTGKLNQKGVIIKYEVNETVLEGLKCLFMENPNNEWAEFVYANRAYDTTKHHNQNQQYDFVYGPLADGAIGILVKDVKSGKIGLRKFLDEIISYKHPFPKDHQISFHSENAIKALTLKGMKNYEKRTVSK